MGLLKTFFEFINLIPFLIFIHAVASSSLSIKEDDTHIINMVKRLIENESAIQNQKFAFLEAKSYSQAKDMVELKSIIESMKTKLDDHVNGELNSKMSYKDEDDVHLQESSPSDFKSVAFQSQKNMRAARLIPNNDGQPKFDGGKLPSSCYDLNLMGHTVNGIYLTKADNKKSNKIATVFCDFQPSKCSSNLCGPVEKVIGYLDIKSSPAPHFYVQRNKTARIQGEEVVIFNVERLNTGGAMNMKTGVFTVPKNGIYQFSISFIKDTNSFKIEKIQIHLRLNKKIIGTTFSSPGFFSTNVAFQSVLRLKQGDQIDVYKKEGVLDSQNDYSNHFSGWLVEEDLGLEGL